MPKADSFIPLSRPWMDEREALAAGRAILSGWVAQGPEVEAFEKEFAAFVNARHACAVSSCTAALHLALKAVGVGPGDEVITASYSFIATANAVRYCGAVPVFVDVEPATFNMDPELIERVVTRRTRAVLCVHQMGLPGDLEAILAVARRHGLPVVEDAACAAGREILWDGEWQRIGRPHGDVACFSFHPRKIVTVGEGGMLTTGSAEYDDRFRLWREHSTTAPAAARRSAASVVFEEYAELGYNYKMTDIQAAVGRVQLERLPEIVGRRRRLGARYTEMLAGVAGVGLPVEPRWARTNHQSFCVRLPAGVDRRAVMEYMLEAGVASRPGIGCSHCEPAYRRQDWSCGVPAGGCPCPPGRCERLVESERARDATIILPLYCQMTGSEQARVVRVFSEALAAARTE